MRVVSVSHHADFIGGGELSLLQFLQSLHRKGEDVSLIVPAAGECQQQAQAEGIPTACLPMPALTGPGSIAALGSWLKHFRRHRCDVLHANTSRAAFYAGMVGRRLGIPVVFHCRVAERDRRLDWLIARMATVIVANSHASARRFLPRFSSKVEVIYNGVDMPERSTSSHHIDAAIGEGPLLLCVARLSRWKRHDLVLEAFALLAEKMPELQLAMLGGSDPHDPEWSEILQQRSASLSCADRIHWLGQRKDIAAWYGAADVLILASREEPFGRVVVEAMAAGVPVVAANAGGPAEIIEQGLSGVLVDEDTPSGWAAAVDSLLSDDDFRAHVIQNGRRRAEEFSLDRHVASMASLFSRLAGGEAEDAA